MPQPILMGLIMVAAIVGMSARDVFACGASRKVLSAAEQARAEKAFAAERIAVQGQNIKAIDKALQKAKVSGADRAKAKELRDEAAKLSGAGKLDDANRALHEAWKMLGHPELFVVVALPNC